MGRNIWQSEYPVAMITSIREIVHNGASVREAQQAFEEAKKTKTPILTKNPVM